MTINRSGKNPEFAGDDPFVVESLLSETTLLCTNAGVRLGDLNGETMLDPIILWAVSENDGSCVSECFLLNLVASHSACLDFSSSSFIACLGS